MKCFDHSVFRRFSPPPLGLSGLLLAGALLLGACSEEKTSDDTYAVVVSGSFTFDAANLAYNTIQVTANTDWQVYWTPAEAAVTVEPLSGRGDGSFCIMAMPEGMTVQFGVRTASGKSANQLAAVTRPSSDEGGGDGGEGGGDPAVPYRFPELPSNWVAPTAATAAILSDHCAFFTRWTTSVTSRKRLRNYSYCYDTQRHNPIWVAYPMHAVYLEGGYGRTDPDPWAPDPALDASHQSKIYSTGADDVYQYWATATMSSLYEKGDIPQLGTWTKGHLCMSRERGGRDQEINRQTFYPTNVAPQPNSRASTFGTVWGYVEALISGSKDTDNDITADDNSTNVNMVDTCYVVAGCYYEHDNWKDYDASNSGQQGSGAKLCVMPTHQWKMMLRKKDNVSKTKTIAECTADELQAVAFWVETFTQSDAAAKGAKAQLREIMCPVSDVEQKMGMTFYPDVPAEVKSRTPDPEAWGF